MELSTEDYGGVNGYKKAISDIFKAMDGTDCTATKSFTPAAVSEAEKAAPEVISKVYYHMISILELSETHKADLLRRGLTEADIRRFKFRSMPADTKAFAKSMYFWCKKNGLSLEGVPGFYRMQNGFWNLRKTGDGYLCPVFHGNLIAGFQIRVDNPLNGGKYLWLSSTNQKDGVSSGSPSTFLKGENEKCILIVEGVLKATVVYCLLKGKVTVIGCPGIKVINGVYPFLRQYSGNAYVIEAYDMEKQLMKEQMPLFNKANALLKAGTIKTYMDLCGQEYRDEFHDLLTWVRVTAAAEELCKKVEEYDLGVHPLTWDMKDSFWTGTYKGLDDFLQAYPEEMRELFVTKMAEKAEKHLKMKAFFG